MCLLQAKEDVTSATQWASDYDPDYASWLPPSGMYLCYVYIRICIMDSPVGIHICTYVTTCLNQVQ